MMRRLRPILLGIAGVVLVGVAWEVYKALAPDTGVVIAGITVLPRTSDLAMPHLGAMLDRTLSPVTRAAGSPALWLATLRAASFSFGIAVVGWLVGVVVGIAIAIVMQRFRTAQSALLPWVVLSQTVPLIALAPLVRRIGTQLSTGGFEWQDWMSVALIASYLAFFPVSIGALRGFGSPTAEHLDLMRAYGVGWWRTFLAVRVPASIPFLLPALRLAAVNAVVGTIVAEWESWHRAHEERRASDDGFLAVTGLYWLDETPVQPAGAPGAWTTGPDGVEVRLAAGESVTVDGREVTGGHRFAPIAERASVVVGFADGVIEVARRGGRDILRPRRRDAAYLAGYHGTPTYVPNTRWRAEARFEAYDAPRPITVDAAVDGIQHVYDAPGELVFSLRGEEFRLIAFPGRTDDLLVLFTDATSGLTTYAASRSLAVPPPDADGRTVIDFNRAVNLPCAYTDFATCPLPPTGNRLPVGIEGGEKTPLARVVGHVTAHGLELAPVEATPVEASPAEVAPAEVAR